MRFVVSKLIRVLLIGGTVLYTLFRLNPNMTTFVPNVSSSVVHSKNETKTDASSHSQSSSGTLIRPDPSSICHTDHDFFGLSSHASALSIWTNHLDAIHNASRLELDTNYEYHDLTATLLHLMSPRLPNSVKAVPRDWQSVSHVLEHVVLPRWKYLVTTKVMKSPDHKSPDTTTIPRPVKIVVMGGSVVAGINCLKMFSNHIQNPPTQKQCAWPHRLQEFLDKMTAMALSGTTNAERIQQQQDGSFLLEEHRLFQVHAAVMSGSNTISGNAILEFDLLPPSTKHPDIIINAFSTNDMHLSTFHQEYKSTNNNGNNNNTQPKPPTPQKGSYREKILEVLQDFVRLAYETSAAPPECPSQSSSSSQSTTPHYPPIIMHLDDYLGNEQREIMATTELAQAVSILSTYYGTLDVMSYPDMVRDWVYGDTRELWFSPAGWYPSYKQDKSVMKREIHPGMPMHMTVTWIVAYHMLNLLTTYCDRHAYAREHHSLLKQQQKQQQQPHQKIYDQEYDLARDHHGLPLPTLRGANQFRAGKPRVPPNGLPPPLHPDLSLQEVSMLWRNNNNNQNGDAECTPPSSSDSSPAPKCPFAWVSGLVTEHNELDERGVEAYFQEHSLEYETHGWELSRHGEKKMGFAPKSAKGQPSSSPANMTLVFGATPSSPIRYVVLFYMKSYGKAWENSRIQIRLGRQRGGGRNMVPPIEIIQEHQLDGSHAKNTSEMYIERMTLRQPLTHSDVLLRITVTLLSGTNFKIMGLLVCR